MALKHLVELEYNPVPLFQSTSIFKIPPFYTAESRQLLEYLEQMYWRNPDSRTYHFQLCTSLAEAALDAETITEPSRDTNLILVIRQIWQSIDSQPSKPQDSTIQILQKLARKITDPQRSRPLMSILANIKEADHTVMAVIVSASTMEHWVKAAEHVLSCFPRDQLAAYASSVTSQLVQMAQRNHRLPKSTYVRRLNTWVELLHRLDITTPSRRQRTILLDLALTQISEQVFAFTSGLHVGSDAILIALLRKLQMRHSYDSLAVKVLLKLITSRSKATPNHTNSVKVAQSLAQLFDRMKRYSLPYEDLLESFLIHISQHGSLSLALRMLTEMERYKLTLRDFYYMDKLVAAKVSAIQRPENPATESQRQLDAYSLYLCRQIFELLSKITVASGTNMPSVTEEAVATTDAERQVRHILDRAKDYHALPLASRNLSVKMPAQERVNLIHQLAHHYSVNTTRTQLENWRAVYYLYRHLQQHGLPIGSLFTKAVVRVSITRPLIECRFVSARRLLWVCRLVARVEGQEVAKGIEHNFWLWRGDLILYAKRVFMRSGGSSKEKAHLGTMKRLKLI